MFVQILLYLKHQHFYISIVFSQITYIYRLVLYFVSLKDIQPNYQAITIEIIWPLQSYLVLNFSQKYPILE
jgi:hypothetical protein